MRKGARMSALGMLLAAAVLSGCHGDVYSNGLARGEELCKANQGINAIRRDFVTGQYTLICNNEAVFSFQMHRPRKPEASELTRLTSPSL